jgi:NADH-quinone oxidoreductase subunit B
VLPLLSTAPRSYSVAADPRIRVVLANLGLACCALEVESAVRLGLLEPGDADAPSTGPTVLLVSGTVTDVLVPAVLDVLDHLPDDTQVVSFGACAATGGPYWDAPSVSMGVDQFTPVARYVPGCPPRPDALVAGLLALAEGMPV